MEVTMEHIRVDEVQLEFSVEYKGESYTFVADMINDCGMWIAVSVRCTDEKDISDELNEKFHDWIIENSQTLGISTHINLGY